VLSSSWQIRYRFLWELSSQNPVEFNFFYDIMVIHHFKINAGDGGFSRFWIHFLFFIILMKVGFFLNL